MRALLLVMALAGLAHAAPFRADDGVAHKPRASRPTCPTGKTCYWTKDDGTYQSTTAGVDTPVGGGTTTVTNCVSLPAGQKTHIDHGLVWDPTSNYDTGFGYFVWARWDSGEYVLADGTGGGHAILLGYDINGNVAGNTWDGTTPVSFGGDDPVASGQWHQIAVAWSQARQVIMTYVNGVPVGSVAWNPVHRQSQAGTLYVGGSDHNNFFGRIATVLGIEGIWPFQAHLTGVKQAFRADRFMGAKIQGVDLPRYVSILADYGAPGSYVRSTGLGGVEHPGRMTNSATLDIGGSPQPRYVEPGPSRVYDAACPVQYPSPAQSTWGQVIPTAPATPGGARVFDSFSRADQDLTTETTGFVGLGSTEAGSLGSLAWLNQGGVWGIHNGRAFYQGGDASYAPTWVENGVADMDVSITRRVGTWGNGDTGLAVRVVDASNFVEAVLFNPAVVSGADGKIYLTTVVAGVETTNIGNASPNPSNFTVLRVVAKANAWSVYTDGNLIISGSNSTHSTATKAGILGRWQTAATNANGLGRWDNFTIGATP